MKVLMCKPRFAPLVEKGIKRQTIRPKRKRPIKQGDALSLRRWEGKPYRSKHQLLKSATCSGVDDIVMHEESLGGTNTFFVVEVEGVIQDVCSVDAIAKADGFSDSFEFWQWFKEEHGLPFRGDMIRW